MSEKRISLFPKIRATIDFLEKTVLSLLLLAMIGLACLQIVMRNIFSSGFADAESILRMMVLWVGLLGAIAASRSHKHIAIDVITRVLSDDVKRVVHTFIYLFVATVCTIITWHATRFVAMEFEAGEVAFGSVPAWITELILPFAFGTIALHYFAATIESVAALIRGKA